MFFFSWLSAVAKETVQAKSRATAKKFYNTFF